MVAGDQGAGETSWGMEILFSPGERISEGIEAAHTPAGVIQEDVGEDAAGIAHAAPGGASMGASGVPPSPSSSRQGTRRDGPKGGTCGSGIGKRKAKGTSFGDGGGNKRTRKQHRPTTATEARARADNIAARVNQHRRERRFEAERSGPAGCTRGGTATMEDLPARKMGQVCTREEINMSLSTLLQCRTDVEDARALTFDAIPPSVVRAVVEDTGWDEEREEDRAAILRLVRTAFISVTQGAVDRASAYSGLGVTKLRDMEHEFNLKR